MLVSLTNQVALEEHCPTHQIFPQTLWQKKEISNQTESYLYVLQNKSEYIDRPL